MKYESMNNLKEKIHLNMVQGNHFCINFNQLTHDGLSSIVIIIFFFLKIAFDVIQPFIIESFHNPVKVIFYQFVFFLLFSTLNR